MSSNNNLRSKLDGNELDMSMMRLTEIPVADIATIPKATKLDLSNNEIVSVSENFSKLLPHIVKVDLGSNKITVLPSTFGNLHNLNHLDLYNNQLTDLPLSLANLKNLKHLDLKGNPLKPELAKAVGNCSNRKECQQAASNLIAYLTKAKEEKEKQLAMKAKKEKEQALARQKKEEEEQAKKRAEKKAAEKKATREKKKQELQKTKLQETNGKQKAVVENNKQPKKPEIKKAKKQIKATPTKSKGWCSLSFFNVILLVVAFATVGTCLMLHSEGDLSLNGFKTIALPKLRQNSLKLLNKTRETFTKENIKDASIKTWTILQPMLHKAKDLAVLGLISAKESAISFYETLITGDLHAYADGAKSIWSSFVKFSIWSLEAMQELFRQIDWVTFMEGVRWTGEYIFGRLTMLQEMLLSNDSVNSYWKNTETFRSTCWNYTLVAKDAVVKVSNDFYVDYYPLLKDRAIVAFHSVQEYVTKLIK